MRKITRRSFLQLSSVALGSAVFSLFRPTGNSSADLAGKSATPTLNGKNGKNKSTPQAKKDKSDPAQSGPGSGNPNFVAMPIPGRPTGNSITIHVIPARDMTIRYEYGTLRGIYSSQTAPQQVSAGLPVETLVTGLQVNTRYYYRICYDNTNGPEQSFVTCRSAGSSFTFAIQGDSHPERVNKQFDPELYALTLQSAGKDLPDFYLTAGDDFSVDTLKTVDAETVKAVYQNQRQWLSMVGTSLFLMNGNHEQASLANLDGLAENVSVWAQTSRNSLFPQPAPDDFYTGDKTEVDHIGLLRDYYAFTWGDALFVMIDPYWHSPVTVDNQYGTNHDSKGQRDLWQVTIGDEQYQWFKETLENSSARYKFVFCHHVLGTQRGGIEVAKKYEWGDDTNLAAHRPGWTKSIHRLMADNHVSIFFQGHDHIFARQELDGVVYQTLPSPADPNYALMNADSFLSGDKLPGSGYVRVSVNPDKVLVEYIREFLPADETGENKSGEVAYSYSLAGR